jgi:phosphoribosylanthranilate isomerase
MKKLKVKICGMKEPQNIKEISILNPDYLGFIFYDKSPRYMDKNPDAIPETDAKRVGVFVNSDIETIIKKAREFKLNTIQLHGDESPKFCSTITELGYEVFKAFRVDDSMSKKNIQEYKGTCSAFLFDANTVQYGGSGNKFNWDKLDELADVDKFFLSGGINKDDVDEIKKLNYANLVGVDLNSRFEIKPGVKDVNMLKEFLLKIVN